MMAATAATLLPTFLPEVIKDLLGNISAEETEKAGAVVNALFLYGWMFGGFTWGMICDRFGRKNSVVLSTAAYAVFALLTAFSPSWQWLLAFRFITGFGIGGIILVTTVIISESWIPSKRPVAIGMITICFPVGVFLTGAIAYIIPGWREAFMVSVIPLLLAFIAQRYLEEPVPDSTDRSVTVKSDSFFYDNDIKRKLLIGSIAFGTMLIGLWAVFSWLPSFVNELVTGSDAKKERGIAMMSLAGAALLGGALTGPFIRWIGWKISLIACFAVCFITCYFLFRHNTSFSWVVYFESGLLGFFFGISQGVLSDYIPKIFPASVRATATGFCFNAGRLFTATVVFFVGWLVSSLGSYGNSLFTFSFIFLVGLITTFSVKDHHENVALAGKKLK
jgi:MFS family permease